MNKKLIRKATCWSVLNSCLLYLLPALAFAAPTDLEHVRELYQQTEYEQARRNLDVARKLLEQYLNSPLTPDDPPRSEAQQLLKKAAKG